jgi:hypothetical protein
VVEHKTTITEVLKMQRLHAIWEAAKQGGLSFFILPLDGLDLRHPPEMAFLN